MKETFPSWRPPAHQLGLSGPLITGDSVQSSLTPLEHLSTNHNSSFHCPTNKNCRSESCKHLSVRLQAKPRLGKQQHEQGNTLDFHQHVCGSSIKHTVRILSLFVPGPERFREHAVSTEGHVGPLFPATVQCLSQSCSRQLRDVGTAPTMCKQAHTHSCSTILPASYFYVFDSVRFILCIRHLFFFSKWVLGWYSYWLFPHFSDS